MPLSHRIKEEWAASESQEPSIRIFRHFIVANKRSDGTVQLDASSIVSSACYQLWLDTRIGVPNYPQRTFQRSLTAHLTGSDERQPFLAEEEAAILKVVRVKRIWLSLYNVQRIF